MGKQKAGALALPQKLHSHVGTGGFQSMAEVTYYEAAMGFGRSQIEGVEDILPGPRLMSPFKI